MGGGGVMLDLKALLAKMLSKGEYKTLLWTNPNPNSSFTAKNVTITGAWNKYDYIEVMYKNNSADDNDMGFKIFDKTPCHSGTCASMVQWASSSSRWEIIHRARWWSSDHTAIYFDSSYWNTLPPASGASGQADGNLVPYKIYGIKWGGVIESIKRFFSTLSSPKDWGWAMC